MSGAVPAGGDHRRDLETFTTRNASVVRLTTSDGDMGIGQISRYQADERLATSDYERSEAE